MDLNQLGNTPLQDAVDFDNLPAERGQSAPPPTPGPYRFELTPLSGENFTAIPETKSGPRVQVAFNDAAPLKIVQSPQSLANGDPFTTRLSNVPRQRGKDEAMVASDWDYLNKAFDVAKRPASNKAYAETLLALSKGTPAPQFSADIEWSWNCGDTRDAYFPTGDAGSAPMPDPNTPGANIKGCGAKYYQGQAGKGKAADPQAKKAGYIEPQMGESGKSEYPLYIACSCGATVRAFANLTRIRK